MIDSHAISIAQASEAALSCFNAGSGLGTEGDRVKSFEAARHLLAREPETAVDLLAAEFETDNFHRKAAAYRLMIGLGTEALPAIHFRLGDVGMIERIWLVSILHYHGDSSRTMALVDLAQAKCLYARHLATLALIFQGRQEALGRNLLIRTLAEALLSGERIEGSAFFVADSALSCLRWLTGETFGEKPVSAIHFYNFDYFLFTPPVPPFPYTSDRVNTMAPRQKRQLAVRVLNWWEQNYNRCLLKRMTSCFEL